MAAAPQNPNPHQPPQAWGLCWWWAVVVLVILVVALAFGFGGRLRGGRDTGVQQENSHHVAPAPHH